jgi:hypothetical protein
MNNSDAYFKVFLIILIFGLIFMASLKNKSLNSFLYRIETSNQINTSIPSYQNSWSFVLTFMDIDPISKFYMLYTRFWELAIGSLILFLPTLKHSNKLSCVGLSLILIAVFCFNESMPSPSYFTLLPTIGAAMIILFANNEMFVGRILSFGLFRWIGLISFSAYLIHQPVFVFARLVYLDSMSASIYILLILLTFGSAYFTWRLIENPFRKKELISFRSIEIMIFVYFLIARLDSYLILTNQRISLGEPVKIEPTNCITSFKNETIEAPKNKTENRTSLNPVVNNKMPDSYLFDRGINTEISKEFHLRFWQPTANMKPNFCRIGLDKKSSPNYFVYGDSMGLALSPAFEELNLAGLDGGFCHPLLFSGKSYAQIGYKGLIIKLFNFFLIEFSDIKAVQASLIIVFYFSIHV